jgi:hypothetical protein
MLSPWTQHICEVMLCSKMEPLGTPGGTWDSHPTIWSQGLSWQWPCCGHVQLTTSTMNPSQSTCITKKKFASPLPCYTYKFPSDAWWFSSDIGQMPKMHMLVVIIHMIFGCWMELGSVSSNERLQIMRSVLSSYKFEVEMQLCWLLN